MCVRILHQMPENAKFFAVAPLRCQRAAFIFLRLFQFHHSAGLGNCVQTNKTAKQYRQEMLHSKRFSPYKLKTG